MAVHTAGRTGPAHAVPGRNSRLPLWVLGRSLTVFAGVGLPAHWQATARARPPSVDWASGAQGFAFPSGHATTATAGYLVLAVLISGLLPSARRRNAVRGAGIAVAFLVGASRIVLAVHWPTDVIAGWALGTAVAAATLALGRRPTGPRPGTPLPTEPSR